MTTRDVLELSLVGQNTLLIVRMVFAIQLFTLTSFTQNTLFDACYPTADFRIASVWRRFSLATQKFSLCVAKQRRFGNNQLDMGTFAPTCHIFAFFYSSPDAEQLNP